MNIFQINTADIKGGAGNVAYQLQTELRRRNHDSILLVSRKYAKSDPYVKLIRPDYGWRRRLFKKLAYFLANDIGLFPANHILKMPEFKKADIVHCHNLHTNYFNLSTLEKISKIKPIVWTLHDMWPITAHCAHSFDGALKENGFFACPSLDIYPPIAWHNEKYLERKKAKIYANSNFHIVTPSKWLAEKVSQSVLRDKPLTIIYNGIDTKVFKAVPKNQSRSELGLPQDKKIVLFLAKRGQSNPWKGGTHAEDIINLIKNRDDMFILDIGGDENKSISNRKFIPFVKDERVLAKYYSAADVLLYPSLADNCPLVVLEAMACGLPIVSFNTGGIPELVEHKINGYIATYKNPDDLKAGIEYLLSLTPQETEKIKQYSVNKINSNFTLEKMANRYIELYEKIKPH